MNIMKQNGKEAKIIKYSINIEPDVAANGKLTGQIIKGCKPKINEIFGFYLAFKSNVYSYDMKSQAMEFTTEIEDQVYTLKIAFSKVLDTDDQEYFSFYSIFFKSMMRMMSFE